MIVSIDKTGRTRSVFKCDRCGAMIDTTEHNRYRIDLLKDSVNRKRSKRIKKIRQYDLCTKCANLVYHIIDKGEKKE